MNEYRFVTTWFFSAPPERVFAAIADAEHWPSFWKGVKRVDLLERPAQGEVGTRVRATWRSLLPYDLTFDATTTAFEAPRLIEVAADGQLRGKGRWELSHEPGGTRVVYTWEVTTQRFLMNLLAPVLRPAFRINHDIIMRWGYEGLRRHLGCQ